MNRIQIILKSVAEWLLRAARCSPAPNWYSAQELWEVLRREESPHIANRLSVEYAKNLQQAFNKGYEMGVRKGKQGDLFAIIGGVEKFARFEAEIRRRKEALNH